MEVLQRTGPVTVQGRETLQSVLKNCVLPEVVLDSRKAIRRWLQAICGP